jgi:hypothetical protein
MADFDPDDAVFVESDLDEIEEEPTTGERESCPRE